LTPSNHDWWSWRELNPRPKFLHTIIIMIKTYIYVLKQHISIIWCLFILRIFNALPPICRQFAIVQSRASLL
ncbi:hypothetical protein C3F27_28030, partial [Escherichia coli]